MKAILSQQWKSAVQLLLVAVAYMLLGAALFDVAKDAWRIPAALVMVFFLPVLISSVLQFYWQLCRPVWKELIKSI